MALRRRIWHQLLCSRSCSSNIDWEKLRPMIHKRIQDRAKDYPLKAMLPVAYHVLKARVLLFQGVSTLLNFIPLKACTFCPELYIGKEGHLIRTCHGYRRRANNQVHEWIDGSLKDILVSVETFHLHNMFQDVIQSDQGFDFDRIPAVLELCCQAGVNIYDENLYFGSDTINSYTDDELNSVAIRTLEAWETVRSGVEKLLLIYPTKVCKYCSEVYVGPSGHKARLCGVFKHESCNHLWEKAKVDDLIPPKFVWRRRNQDPPVLLDKGRDFYGHAPAVVELCVQAGAIVPAKYRKMMKVHGEPPPEA